MSRSVDKVEKPSPLAIGDKLKLLLGIKSSANQSAHNGGHNGGHNGAHGSGNCGDSSGEQQSSEASNGCQLIQTPTNKLTEEQENMFKDVLENGSNYRPEISDIRLIAYWEQSIHPNNECWIESLKKLMDTHYKNETKTEIRNAALDVLHNTWSLYSYAHEETLIDSIVMPYLNQIYQENDNKCRERAVNLIIEFIQSCTSAKRCSEMLDILEKLCRKTFEQNKDNNADIVNTASDSEDVKIAIIGLISIFKSKLHSYPGSTAVQAFRIIVSHLNSYYVCSDFCGVNQMASTIKQEIYKLVLNIRTNSRRHIAVSQRTESLVFSSCVLCQCNDLSPSASTTSSPVATQANSLSPPPSPNIHATNSSPVINTWKISFHDMFKVVILCLKTEKEWTVLKLVLNELPKFLKNKALILSCNSNFANDICIALYVLICDRSLKFSEFLSNEAKLSKADIQSAAFPSLSAMIAYQSELESKQQFNIIKCLQSGLVLVSGKTSVLRQCILSFTICAMEMQENMIKYLPDTLISLSKISATVALAIPKLEFLSNVIHLPSLYQSFTNDQYMSVFAIALPYTNPFKFNEFTVALAHRVIAMWFLKCRLGVRRSIVSFIIKGLQTNVMQDDSLHGSQSSEAQRLRSSSLNTDQNMHRKLEARISLTSSPPPTTPSSTFSFSFSNEAVNQSQQTTGNSSAEIDCQESRLELVETCMDMLASYTFSMCSTVPFKSTMLEHLLNRSKSETWIIGHKLITITTSGCSSRATINGLCEKCAFLCASSDNSVHVNNEEVSEYMQDYCNNALTKSSEFVSSSHATDISADSKVLRRRHQSEIQQNMRSLSAVPQSSAYDDLCLNNVQQTNSYSQKSSLCICWCQGWAEIICRRPTGTTSWIMRLQNPLGSSPYSSSPPNELPDLTTLLHSPHISQRVDECRISSVPTPDTNFKTHRSLDVNLLESERASSTPPLSKTTFSSLDAERTAVSNNNCSENNMANASGGHVTPPGTFQPISRAQSFCSRRSPPRIRAEYSKKTKMHMELTTSCDSQHLSNNTSPDSAKFTSSVSPLRNGAEHQTHGHRDRVHTISVMSPVQSVNRKLFSPKESDSHSSFKSSGLCPKFVFLQLYYNSWIDEKLDKNVKEVQDRDRPILLPKTDQIDRSLKCLDRITPYETHKIGVVYVGAGQAKDKTAILSNRHGSVRYTQFMKGLGNFIRLQDSDALINYVGGLDAHGQDGKYAISWSDNLNQVIFHVATLMPTHTNDPNFNMKKRHIGNDFVCIVYNDSGTPVTLSTIKGEGQFIQAIVVITPYEYNSNLVSVHAKDELADMIGHFESQMLSDAALPIYVRQLALHANLGSMVCQSRASSATSPHISNWVQRLKQIKRIRERVANASASGSASKLPVSDSYEDANSSANHAINDTKQYIFPDFLDYA